MGPLASYVIRQSFILFALATALFGVSNGFGTYYRFAADAGKDHVITAARNVKCCIEVFDRGYTDYAWYSHLASIAIYL